MSNIKVNILILKIVNLIFLHDACLPKEKRRVV